MAERDETMVTVKLDRRKPYRARDEDRTAIWVGPGDTQVPMWVAQHWGLVPGEPSPTPPQQMPAAVPADAVSATTETVQTFENPAADESARTSKRRRQEVKDAE